MSDWPWDDVTIPDTALIYRRIGAPPDYRVPDPITNICRPHVSALSVPMARKSTPTGLSGHLRELLPKDRLPPNLYIPTPSSGVISFEARQARAASGCTGVVIVPHCLEYDVPLRDAHVEVRTRTPKNKKDWVIARAEIIEKCRWAQVPTSPCQSCSTTKHRCDYSTAMTESTD